MKSYLFSQLVVRHREGKLGPLGADDWLVWEPGQWQPPTKDASTIIVQKKTNPPVRPPAAEMLVFALAPKSAADPQVTVGRAQSCDIPINDGTLSQVHLVFQKGPSGWTVRDAGSSNGSWVDRQRVAAGKPVALRSGFQIQAAQVNFTYYSTEGLKARLEQAP